MKTNKDILEKPDRIPFSTPNGYFETLKARLSRIPEAGMQPIPRTLWQRVRPYAALAACFAASFLIGNTILRKTTPEFFTSDSFYDQLMFSDLLPVTESNDLYGEDEPVEKISDEDIANYLIESGVPAELIANVEFQNEE